MLNLFVEARGETVADIRKQLGVISALLKDGQDFENNLMTGESGFSMTLATTDIPEPNE